MKIFYFMGRNDKNVSRVSWKIWKIECKGRELTTWWGPAELQRRRPVAKSLQKKVWRYRTPSEARFKAQLRIREKVAGGYERKSRRRTRSV